METWGIVSAAVQAFATVILVVVTIFYVRHTWSMVQAMQEETRPYVCAEMALADSHWGIKLTNKGARTAHGIRVTTSPETALEERCDDFTRDSVDMLKKGVAHLTPHESRFFYVTHWTHWPRGHLNKFTITVRYTRAFSAGKTYEEHFVVRPEEHLGPWVADSYLSGPERIIEAIDDLTRGVGDLALAYAAIRVQCPVCGMLIPREAKVCFRCHLDLPPGWDERGKQSDTDSDDRP